MASEISDGLFPLSFESTGRGPGNYDAWVLHTQQLRAMEDVDRSDNMYTKVLDDIFFADEDPETVPLMHWGYYIHEDELKEDLAKQEPFYPTAWSSNTLPRGKGIPPEYTFIVSNFEGLQQFLAWRW